MNQIHLDILRENIDTLNLSADWVQYSYKQTSSIELKKEYTVDEFNKLENLTSRYARTTDMLVNKALRSIDTVELEDIGTIIDVMNRAEKRGIVSSAELLRTIKDLRNSIAHEYKITEISGFFADVLKYTPVLLEIIKNTNAYCARYLGA
ncbi:hypothetical protein R80B4_01188 [Fibrobacteres bacterium R8-0-B4]